MARQDGGHNLRGALTALAAMGIFATHDAVVKHLGSAYSAVQIVFFSALLSFPLVTFLMLQDREGGSLWPRHPGWVATRTVAAIVSTVSCFYAFATLPLAQTYAILFATPLLITLLSIPVLGEHVRLRRWTAVVVGLAGVLIVLRPGEAALSAGHLAALVSACAAGLAAVIVRKVGNDERPVVLLVYPILGNILVMGAALPFFYRPMPGTDLGLMAVIAVMGLAGTLLSILSYRMAEAVIAAPMQYSQILWATVYGALFFGESPDRTTLAGAAVVIASGIYIVLRETQAGASENHPVLDTRGRGDLPTMPRPSLIQRILQPGARAGR
ncbi:MAG: DMT family transporter [Proteobacteria bacterium]|nr:DMT family transporter [Pseudomonadota bacterium]MBS0572565.1 DMT family transporter [Pseudomonadota bacterium]